MDQKEYEKTRTLFVVKCDTLSCNAKQYANDYGTDSTEKRKDNSSAAKSSHNLILLKVYSTVTDFARFRGLSTSSPRAAEA